MKTSARGIEFIQGWESLALSAYADSGGTLTIGYGHTAGVCEGDTCTVPQADAWLVEDLAWAEDAVNELVAVPLTQSMFDACVSFTYNVGRSAFAESTALRVLNQGGYLDYLTAGGEHFIDWWHTEGSELGLLRRRAAELVLYLENDVPVPRETVEEPVEV